MSKPIAQDILHSELFSLEQKIDKKLERLGEEMHGEIQEMREEHKQYRDEVLTKLDGIAGDIGMLKDENTIGSGQTSQLREQVENHESRIKNLEKIQTSTV